MMSIQIAEFTEKGRQLLSEGKVYLGKGGLRWADGQNKGHIFELAQPVIGPADQDGGNQTIEALHNLAARCSAVQKQNCDALKKINIMSDQISNIEGLQIVNIACSIVNIGVDIIGFYVVCKKIDALDAEIQCIAQKIDAQELRQEKKGAQKLINQMKVDLDKFSTRKTQEEKCAYYTSHERDIDALMMNTKECMQELISWFKEGVPTAEKGELVCNMMALMLTLYCEEIREINSCHFKIEQKFSAQTAGWLSIFSSLTDDAFQSELVRYLALNYPEVSPIKKAEIRNQINALIYDNLLALEQHKKICAIMRAQGVESREELALKPMDIDLSVGQVCFA